MSWQDKVATSINQNLNHPEGFAKAKVVVKQGESLLVIQIGDQAVLFGPVGQDYGAECAEGSARKWDVKRRKGSEDEPEPE